MDEPRQTSPGGDAPPPASAAPEDAAAERRVPVAEERARLLRRRVEAGRVHVRLRTGTEEVPVRAALKREAVTVERIPVGRRLAPGEPVPRPREEEGGAVLVVPVLEEVLVVEKRLVLAEEVRIRRRVVSEPVETTVALRRQRAEVERTGPGAGARPQGGTAEAAECAAAPQPPAQDRQENGP